MREKIMKDLDLKHWYMLQVKKNLISASFHRKNSRTWNFYRDLARHEMRNVCLVSARLQGRAS